MKAIPFYALRDEIKTYQPDLEKIMAQTKEVFDVNTAYEAYLRNPCETELEAVMQQGEPLVRHFAKVYGCGCPFDDLFQSGMVGLMKATKSYDGRAQFSTWASWCIISEIRHFVRSERGFIEPPEDKIGKDSASAAVMHTELYGNELAKSAPEYQSFHLAVEDKVMLEQALQKLSELEKKVIDALFYRQLTQEQTAAALGLNQRKVSRVKKKGLEVLAELLEAPSFKLIAADQSFVNVKKSN